jgi:hypothetical protein
MPKKELSRAIQRFARRHGYFARTVRSMTSLRLAAMAEWRAR